MGRSHSKKRSSRSQCNPGIVGDCGPILNSHRVYQQKILDLKIEQAKADRKIWADQRDRLKAAGFDVYDAVEYNGESMIIYDVVGDMATVDYLGNQYQVKLKDVKQR